MAAVDPNVIMNNFKTIASIIETVGVLMGIGMVMGSFFQFKRYGETRTFMSHQMSLAGPGALFLGGILMLVLPTTISSLLFAFWGTSSPLAYTGSTGGGYAQYIPVVLMFVRLVGVVSLIRGIVLMSRSGTHGGQPGTLGRAMVHIFGGLLALHINGTIHLLKEILDLTVV